ncbi:MAG TPA: type II toxin-antitoxin system VapC family toxin [Phycicoccus sp.]|nr:type II toxin-antitoxin system VapC family toxin [Phycicoccus sp.]
MIYLLDTNVLSELRKRPGVVNEQVLTWSQRHSVSDFAVSVVSVWEIDLGIVRIERRDVRQGAVLRSWFSRAILGDLGPQILPIDRMTAVEVAALHVPDPRPERDALIAATAIVHGLTVVTRNVGDFVPMGVRVLNPWQQR